MTDSEPPRIRHVAIVGAGFSGTLQAINLLRHDGPRVTLIERRAEFGKGVAYSTANPRHLLNVRAANMSALPDDPDHFVRWLAAQGKGGAHGFAARADYGEYLAALLHEATAASPDRLRLVHDGVAEVSVSDTGVVAALDRGGRIAADAAVLALGNLPPHDPAGLGDVPHDPDVYVADPWRADIGAGLSADDTVLILGTGLTMVDVVLTLKAQDFRGRIVALSRRGLLPRAHGDAGAPRSALAERPRGTGADLVRFVRRRADAVGWRAAIDELRPHTQGMWLAASPDEQQRFTRHLRAWWDVHRHRLAPQVAGMLAATQESGQLRIVAGSLAGHEHRPAGIAVRWRPRGGDVIQTLDARRVINCTGPQGDLLRTRQPLLHLLLASGRIRPDRHRFGIDVNGQAETIDVNGMVNRRLLALGPMTRGAFWEIVAVPDIRVQTWAVARRLANAHWVGGEGL